jgi:fatty acid elongase 3
MELIPEAYAQPIVNFEYVSGVTPFSGVHSIVIGLIVYFASIVTLKKTVGDKFKNVNFRYITAFHNFTIFLLSVFMFVGTFLQIISRLSNNGFHVAFCDPTSSLENGGMSFWLYVFYLSKYYEFLDTFLLIIKGKDLEFLHVYHHSLTVFNCWFALESYSPFCWIGMALNTFVHCIMYWYYFNQSLGRNLWWKIYLTQLQMIQFVINFMGLMYYFYLKQFTTCAGTYYGAFLCLWVMTTFFLLFLRFYLRTYTQRKPKTQ